MHRVDTVSACVKCGMDWSMDRELEPEIVYAGVQTSSHAGMEIEYQHNYIERTCIRCGYRWKELPLDVPIQGD